MRRLACGSFDVKNAMNSNEISNGDPRKLLKNDLIPMNEALPNINEIAIDSSVAVKIRNGRQSVLENVVNQLGSAINEGVYFKLIENGELVAIVKSNKDRRNDHVTLEIKRVFS